MFWRHVERQHREDPPKLSRCNQSRVCGGLKKKDYCKLSARKLYNTFQRLRYLLNILTFKRLPKCITDVIVDCFKELGLTEGAMIRLFIL